MAADSRTFFDDATGTLILCPFKCGFATFNQHLAQPGRTRNIDLNAGEAAQADRVIFMVREPVSRFLSFYKNWVVTKNLTDSKPPLKFMRKWLEPAFFDRLDGLDKQDRSDPKLILEFIRNIGPAILNEGHMQPQWMLLYRAGMIGRDDIEFVDYRNGLDVIQNQFAISAEIRNVTGSQSLEINSQTQEALDLLYWRDRALTRQAAACFP